MGPADPVGAEDPGALLPKSSARTGPVQPSVFARRLAELVSPSVKDVVITLCKGCHETRHTPACAKASIFGEASTGKSAGATQVRHSLPTTCARATPAPTLFRRFHSWFSSRPVASLPFLS